MKDTLHIQDIDGITLNHSGQIVFYPHNTFEYGECHELFFPRIEHDGTENMGSGYGFACEPNGWLDLDNMNSCAFGNLISLLRTGSPTNSKEKFGPGRIRSFTVRPYPKRGWILCHCGKPVSLQGFTNTCECGVDYNMSGSELAPRSQWGYETGETADEILRGVAQDEANGTLRSPED